MRPIFLAAVLWLTALSVFAQAAQTVPPREVAAQVAQAVDDHYFDPARGRTIADGLRKKAQGGAYDALQHPLDLASVLSADLQPFDGHFAVVHSPASGAQNPPAGPRPASSAAGFSAQLARQNYGFARTEMLPGGIGYIAVTQFAPIDARAPDDPARKAADAALQSVAGARALVIDLRDSRGGAPEMVAYLASYFVPAGAPIFNTFLTRGENESEAPVVEPTGPRRLDLPLYLLVNGGTGSASESFPYTLQAARRAIVIGEPSNGRANPGGFIRVAGGFSVFVSSGSPRNPITQKNWEGAGVMPDIVVPPAVALRRAQEAALQRLLDADPRGPAAAELRWLLEDLRATPATPTAQALQAYTGSYGDGARVSFDNGTLVLRQGRRATPLRPFAPDLFVSTLDPLLRARFERLDGQPGTLTMLTPDGAVARFTQAGP